MTTFDKRLNDRLWRAAFSAAILVAGVMPKGALSAEPPHLSDKLLYQPPGDWVKPMVMPSLPPPTAAPTQVLLDDMQANFAPDADTFYEEIAYRIQTPQGLDKAQSTVDWNPETDIVTIHKLHILRGDKVIDLLANGQTFTVLRRESNLEQSILDGELTGFLQPEDLQVGDILDFAWSMRRADPVLKGHSEAMQYSGNGQTVSHLRFRALWPSSKPMRWKVSRDLDPPKVTSTADGTEFVIDMKDLRRPPDVDQAPARYSRFGEVQFTQFASWRELSSLMAPLFDKATSLTASSPLKAEAQKIRSSSTDPKVQAAMALHMVQDQVRYLYIGMNEGGYVPADADLTWTRRFGDCKGKTALLVALLRELGIKSDPVLVSAEDGDGINERLPAAGLFNHVIARTEIDGKVYWLDGTRYGDRDIDSLVVPDFAWALPLRDAGADLEPMKVLPLVKPSIENFLTLDVSAGLDFPAIIHAERLLRGDSALSYHLKADGLSPADMETFLRKAWSSKYDWINIQKVSASYDPKTGEEHVLLDGSARMDWNKSTDGKTWSYETDGSGLGWLEKLKRDPGPDQDIPVETGYPSYIAAHETILLPKDKRGFTIEGANVETTLAGTEFRRSAKIVDGVFTMDASTRVVAPEISYREADAARIALRDLSDDNLTLHAPLDYKASSALTVRTEAEPVTAADFAARGDVRVEAGTPDLALSDFNKALQLDPSNARALLGRGYIFMARDSDDLALADFTEAARSDPHLWRAYDGIGQVYCLKSNYGAGIAAFDRALANYPNDIAALTYRGSAYFDQGKKDLARQDAQAALKLNPDAMLAERLMAQIDLLDHKRNDAVILFRKVAADNPKDENALFELANVLTNCSLSDEACTADRAEAVTVYSQAIALKPSLYAYVMRALYQPTSEHQKRMDDIDAAIALDPKSNVPYSVRASVYMEEKDLDKALADANRAIVLRPILASGYSLRARVYLAMNKINLALADYDKLIQDHPTIISYRNSSCWERATHNIELEKAKADCDAALKIKPDVASVLDSRGFVELRMGLLDLAVSDYDAALKLRPDMPTSLYGRGLAKIKKGLAKDGQADLVEARKIETDIDETFAGYGLKP